jgi:chromate transporter
VGFVLPGATLILALAIFISNFAEMPAVKHAFAGIRIAVGALILETVIKLVKGVFKKIEFTIIYIIVFAVSVFPKGAPPFSILPAFIKSPVFIVLASGLAGIILYRRKKKTPTAEGAEK